MNEVQLLQTQNLPSHKAQIAAVDEWLTAEIDAQRLTYTGLFAAGPFLSTLAAELLDGVTRGSNGAPAGYSMTEPRHLHPDAAIVLCAVRLSSGVFSPGGELFVDTTRLVRRIGKVAPEREDYRKSYGAFAAVPDSWPDRTARMIVWRHSWPRHGNSPWESTLAIEWDWVRQQLELPERDRVFGVEQCAEACLATPGFQEFLDKRAARVAEVPITPVEKPKKAAVRA